MSYTLQSLKKPRNLQTGISERALIAKKEWFEPGGIKVPAAPFNTAAAVVTVSQQHVFKSGYGFLEFQLAPEKNSFKGSTTGDTGLKRQSHELTIFVPGLYEEVYATMSDLLNTPLIALAGESDCSLGTNYQFGNECVAAWISWEMTSGSSKDGVKGFAVTLTCDAPLLFFKAEGEITKMPVVVAGAPVITSQPVGYPVTAGETLALSVGATNAVSYQWKKGGVDIAGATKYVFAKANAASGDAGNYTCVVTNANGSVTTAAAVITVV